jgi:predicted SprT family Zn-dependent metalloprotease
MATKKTKFADTETAAIYGALFAAYDHFNRELFDNKLTETILTLNSGKKNMRGYHWDGRFQNREGNNSMAEIALNPECFDRPDDELLSTLVHEMCHHEHCLIHAETGLKSSKPGRGGNHTRYWVNLMEDVGLTAVQVGKSWQRVTHTIDAGGEFAESYKRLAATGWALNWRAIAKVSAPKKSKASKVKYTCNECGSNAWAKPETSLTCGDCDTRMEASV